MSTAQENLEQARKKLNIYICTLHEQYLLAANGKHFYIYGFDFFGVGQDKFPNDLLNDGIAAQEFLGPDRIAFARDGMGGYFYLMNNQSKVVGFKSPEEEYEYAKNVERFFEAFEKLDSVLQSFESKKAEANPNYDPYEDREFAALTDMLYEKVMAYLREDTKVLEL